MRFNAIQECGISGYEYMVEEQEEEAGLIQGTPVDLTYRAAFLASSMQDRTTLIQRPNQPWPMNYGTRSPRQRLY